MPEGLVPSKVKKQTMRAPLKDLLCPKLYVHDVERYGEAAITYYLSGPVVPEVQLAFPFFGPG